MKQSLVLVAGAGGFIGGHLVKHLMDKGLHVRAVDIKPLDQWYQVHPAMNHCMDLSQPGNCEFSVRSCDTVYNLAADMGGMGFIETHRVECLRSVLINTHLIEAAAQSKVSKYFYASSACVYNTDLQKNPNVVALKETDDYPAKAERGYGWEKLFSEIVCQEYWAECGLATYIARFHNVYGPHGTWDGGREKAPAAICRKVLEGIDRGQPITIWGDGEQTRSFMFIKDCLEGIERIVSCNQLRGVPINLGSSELVSINQLVDKVESISGSSLMRKYDITAPKGVAGRNSDNTFIKSMLGWEPSTSLIEGLTETYLWIKQEYERKRREA